ncbi:ABC transporter [Capsaspora owczarzaki ATCC 30864]|uniref:ABC transporter n=1 Tax=Capsaspora owczarzaki (strain ATCC 30864) TaxID=595528 RepID=A0A0D2U4E0_CAPO3|nr:ABC transporter [Capsaspora owczarzaki ATCC 30864]KJE90030.1 ABC transporter [Capsaspora owczarzaki ATCC 30864]KJE90031.1 ABC transporter, variant [Capsaspora owczarzaki ATCC 30864]|eukprot:XP_004349931.2 ABC transporter [Capsaspora owczarzaki ATCC 30864]
MAFNYSWLAGPICVLLVFVLFPIGWHIYVRFRTARQKAFLDKLRAAKALGLSRVPSMTWTSAGQQAETLPLLSCEQPLDAVSVEVYQKQQQPASQAMYGSGKGHSVNSDITNNDDRVPLLLGGASSQQEEQMLLLGNPEMRFQLRFEKLGLKLLRSDHKVLEGVTGQLMPGRLTAVMGGSGAGKSSFLTTLAGRATYGEELGLLEINGIPDSLKRYKHLVGFVPQEDTMLRMLTVYETLYFSAMTRLPRHMSTQQKLGLIETVLEVLGLSEIRFSKIGDEDTRGISGGQRKRVNIGIEMVGQPSVLFLDEPTSGLDSSSSKEVCGCLQRLAKTGLTVVAVVHQPRYEIFDMLDDLLLLGKGGRTVYLGPSKQALSYFEGLGFRCPSQCNPADFLIDVCMGEVAREGRPDFTPADLFTEWSQQAALQQQVGGPAGGETNSVSEPEYEVPSAGYSLQHQFVLQKIGSWCEFTAMFWLCLAIPIAIPYAIYSQPRSVRRAEGGALGTAISMTFIFGAVAAAIAPHAPSAVADMLSFMGAFSCVVVVIVLVRVCLRHDPLFLAHVLGGMSSGPFFMWFVWKRADVAGIQRYGAVLGCGCYMLLLGLLVLIGQLGTPNLYVAVSVGLIPLQGLALLVVFASRYRRLPTKDRVAPSVLTTTWQVAKRGLLQLSRSWLAIGFDLGLMFCTGLFMGVLFFDRPYQPPIIDSLFPSGNCTELPEVVCTFLQLPKDDPIPSEASLTCLAVALSAVTSSLRIFGNETTVFRRESAAALSTEAYYLGKSLAHLPVIVLAPLFFTLGYYSLLQPSASFWPYFLLYFHIYFACAGIAYLISVLVPRDMSQLAGVLVVLVFMMFSGSSPNLQQLADNKLIPNVLVYPTYISLFRFSQEAYYLVEIAPFHTNPVTMNKFYGYEAGDFVSCFVVMSQLAIVFRMAAYVGLVRREV